MTNLERWAIDIEEELKNKGIEINEEEITVEEIAEYILTTRLHSLVNNYTLTDWIRDTKDNYPEYFK